MRRKPAPHHLKVVYQPNFPNMLQGRRTEASQGKRYLQRGAAEAVQQNAGGHPGGPQSLLKELPSGGPNRKASWAPLAKRSARPLLEKSGLLMAAALHSASSVTASTPARSVRVAITGHSESICLSWSGST